MLFGGRHCLAGGFAAEMAGAISMSGVQPLQVGGMSDDDDT
jgi:hypothetical protein